MNAGLVAWVLFVGCRGTATLRMCSRCDSRSHWRQPVEVVVVSGRSFHPLHNGPRRRTFRNSSVVRPMRLRIAFCSLFTDGEVRFLQRASLQTSPVLAIRLLVIWRKCHGDGIHGTFRRARACVRAQSLEAPPGPKLVIYPVFRSRTHVKPIRRWRGK